MRPEGESFRVYELGEEEKQVGKKNCLCLVPYSNPSRRETEIMFFPVLSENVVDIRETGNSPEEIALRSELSRQDYVERVTILKHHIQIGDIYEINFCVEFYTEHAKIDSLQVFQKLCRISRAPYASLLKAGSSWIISASPELFLKKTDQSLISKPIKGTARRGETPEEDEKLKKELYNSVKERTENVMAVDVARNDLSMLATRGSVKVNGLYNIETFETVHQMVSTVSCELKEGSAFQDIIHATFPMASMTGAPKISAMNLIDRYETFQRNFYAGAMGLLDAAGDFELAVNIRCIFYNEETGRLSIAVGSAITHLSDPEREYDECLLKARALLRALGASIREK